MQPDIRIRVADIKDIHFATLISSWYVRSSEERGTGIARRTPQYIVQKMMKGNAIIAFSGDVLAGFCYVETFSNGDYVSNSGLIVDHPFRGQGLARKIKEMAFHHARDRFPNAKVFGITTSDIVMKLNSELGYRPVSFDQLTRDAEFWNGCSSCANYDILMRNKTRMCLCTGMMAPSKNESTLKSQLTNEEKKEHE